MLLVIIVLAAIAIISEMTCPNFDENKIARCTEQKYTQYIDENGKIRLKKYDDKVYKARMKMLADLKKAQKIHGLISFIASTLLLTILVWCNKGILIELWMELLECFQ